MMTDNRENRNNRCGCGPQKNCRELMDMLRAVSFSMAEVVLYLDAYPQCEEALEYYNKLKCEQERLRKEIEESCGPLTSFGNNGDTWKWTEGPWPWEPEAN